MAVEIERKFLLGQLPTAAVLGPGRPLRQGYLAEEGDTAVRIRIAADEAILTVKAGRGLSRTEVELPVPEDEAEALWLLTDGRRIVKTRYRVELAGGLTAEVDRYDGALAGLGTVEVEFGSEDDAGLFDPPEWFGRDLTDEPGWTNAALARYGRPEPPRQDSADGH